MIKTSESFSPFTSAEKRARALIQQMSGTGKTASRLSAGFERLDQAVNGIRGINILGGQPKAGKSCFFMQVSTEMARRKIPVIYYDFETAARRSTRGPFAGLSRLAEEEVRLQSWTRAASERLDKAFADFKEMLQYYRVVTDRKLSRTS